MNRQDSNEQASNYIYAEDEYDKECWQGDQKHKECNHNVAMVLKYVAANLSMI